MTWGKGTDHLPISCREGSAIATLFCAFFVRGIYGTAGLAAGFAREIAERVAIGIADGEARGLLLDRPRLRKRRLVGVIFVHCCLG
jgi:hypothetical protein